MAAHRKATARAFPKLVRELTGIIGKKLTAYIAGVKDVRALDRWIEGAEPYENAEARLRFAYRAVRTLENHDHASVVQAWLIGLNPELNDRVPIRPLREGDTEKAGPEILGAVRAFVAGGQAIPLTAELEGLIYRLARGPDPWQPLDSALVRMGPSGIASTIRRARIAYSTNPPNGWAATSKPSPEWAETRMLGSATQYGPCADIYGDEWIAILRRDLAADCHELAELNAAVLQQSGLRELTKRTSRLVYSRAFNGILYLSRYGRNIVNRALFEPFKINLRGATPLDLCDPDPARSARDSPPATRYVVRWMIRNGGTQIRSALLCQYAPPMCIEALLPIQSSGQPIRGAMGKTAGATAGLL